MTDAVVMLSVHNEADFIGQVIENLVAQGLSIVALDNGSDDGAHDVCASFGDRGLLELHRWEPAGLDLTALTRRLYSLAMRHSPKWLLWCDGDELLQSATPTATLADAIRAADSEGCNLVQFDRFDFFMTDDDDRDARSVRERLRRYSWQGDYNYRAWKVRPGIAACPSLAHYPVFPDGVPYRIHREKQVLRHYPYRDPVQAKAKIATLLSKFPDNVDRLVDWQRRYVRVAEDGAFSSPVGAEKLARYDGDGHWDRTPRFTPFVDRQPTRSELFTADGRLAHPPAATVPLDT